jgi:hypothetical protein
VPPKPEIITVLVKLIRDQLGLDNNHVVTYNQRIPIPPDDGIFVAIGIVAENLYANSVSYEVDYVPNPELNQPELEVFNEVQTQNTQEVYSIQIMSRNNDARARRHEIMFALNSTQSEQIQEKYGFKIANQPRTYNDVSMGEGASRLNRYAFTLNVLSSYGRTVPVDYYDQYQGIEIIPNI